MDRSRGILLQDQDRTMDSTIFIPIYRQTPVKAFLSLADPGFGQGGPRIFFQYFADIAKWSWVESRAHPRALEGLAFLTLKYALSTFPGTFSSNYFMYLCVSKLQNIYFNMNDSEHFGKCNFPFLCLRQSRVLVVHLLLFADTLLCKLGVWGLLRTPEAVILLTVKYTFSHFPGTFPSKI